MWRVDTVATIPYNGSLGRWSQSACPQRLASIPEAGSLQPAIRSLTPRVAFA